MDIGNLNVPGGMSQYYMINETQYSHACLVILIIDKWLLNKKNTSYEIQWSSSYEDMVGVRGDGSCTPGYVNHNKSGHMEYTNS